MPDFSNDADYQALLRQRLMEQMDRQQRGLEFDDKTGGEAARTEGALQRQLILSQALNKAAAQAGTLNGKMADTSAVDNSTSGLLKAQQFDQEGMQKAANDRDKLQQYLMGKMLDQEGMISKQRQEADQMAFKARENDKDRALKKGESDAKMAQERALKPDQTTAATYARRLEEAEANFRDLVDKGYDPTSKSAGLQRALVPDAFASENSKLQAQAERNFINAVLRRESGASISPTEFDSAEKQYFPRVGDTPQVLAQKARNREIVFNGLKAAAGPAYSKVEMPERVAAAARPGSGSAVAAPLPKDGDIKMIKGKPYRRVPNGWMPVEGGQ